VDALCAEPRARTSGVDAAELLTVLATGDFSRLEGVSEGAAIDFKGEPYQLDDEYGKFELAKDVAAFANGYEDAAITAWIPSERMREASD
jgi:hypothetical protein